MTNAAMGRVVEDQADAVVAAYGELEARARALRALVVKVALFVGIVLGCVGYWMMSDLYQEWWRDERDYHPKADSTFAMALGFLPPMIVAYLLGLAIGHALAWRRRRRWIPSVAERHGVPAEALAAYRPPL